MREGLTNDNSAADEVLVREFKRSFEGQPISHHVLVDLVIVREAREVHVCLREQVYVSDVLILQVSPQRDVYIGVFGALCGGVILQD